MIRDLEPKGVWNNFADLNAVPRPSKKEEKVIQFAKNFGENLGFETIVDVVGNVIIKKPASPGMEDRKTVILQSHLDMVCQKNSDKIFDFETQGIEMLIENDWVTADGTTLGADNGMGVAAIMTILEATDIAHPAIEALFTIDEETGMTGAFGLEQGILDGTILLNLDTEDDDEYSIGCAGGVDTNTSYNYETEPAKGDAFEITIKGLKGGHSGVDIALERGNANLIMNRLIWSCEDFGLRIAAIDGGSLRNAIPRESVATIVVEDTAYLAEFETRKAILLNELTISDPLTKITIVPTELPKEVVSEVDTFRITSALKAVFNGVHKMSLTIKNLVETSSSLARVIVADGQFITKSLQRSSIESGKDDVSTAVGSVFELMGCEVEYTGEYPGWEPNPNSEILDLMQTKYATLFGEGLKVTSIHAGLECGLLGKRYPGLDMISFGPTIKNPHSPDEKVNIASVQKFWKLLLDTLKDIPKK
jgi:dipeptidase D